MSKQGSTKDEILKLISGGDETLSSISEKLELAPSTVSKHLKDLKADGTIVQRHDGHVRKWKYYAINSGNRNPEGEGAAITSRNVTIVIASATIVAVLASLAYGMLNGGAAHTQRTVNVPISITDPPTVPTGTTALYINYSSISVTISKAGSPETIPINASGRIDLMGLVNESQVIGTFTAQNDSALDGITFNISSASISIGNATYPVQLQSSNVSADIISKGRFNSSSGILLDFFPMIVPIYSNGTASFEMMAALRAAVVPSQAFAAGGQVAAYSRQPLPPEIIGMFPAESQSIAVTDAHISVSGNTMSLYVDMRNNASNNIAVFGVMLGSGRLELPPDGGASGGISVSAIAEWPVNGTVTRSMLIYNNSMQPDKAMLIRMLINQTNTTLSINASKLMGMQGYVDNGSLEISLPRPVTNLTITGIAQPDGIKASFGIGGFMQPDVAAFIANSNGTLSQITAPVAHSFTVSVNGTDGVLPDSHIYIDGRAMNGYAAPGMSTSTLSYTGPIPMTIFGSRLNTTSGNYTIIMMTSDGMVQWNSSS